MGGLPLDGPPPDYDEAGNPPFHWLRRPCDLVTTPVEMLYPYLPYLLTRLTMQASPIRVMSPEAPSVRHGRRRPRAGYP